MQSIPERYRVYVILFVLTVLIAGGNILFLTKVAHDSPWHVAKEYPAVSSDIESEFATLAINIVDHGTFSLATSSPYILDSWRTPGYPVFIAPFYALFHNFYPVLFAQILTLFLTVVLLFRMGERIMGRRFALALCVLYLLLPDTGLAAATLMTENVFVLVFMSALYLLFFSRTENFYLRFAGTGFLLALAAYIRPASLYILFFFIPAYFLLYLPWKDISRKQVFGALILILTFMATLAPWCIRNEVRFGNWSFESAGAYVLFRQNAAQFYSSYAGIPNLEARFVLEDMAGIPRGPVPIEAEYSAVMEKVALGIIFAHPFRYAIFHVTGFIAFFTASGAHDYWWLVQTMQPNFDPAPEPSLLQALHPFSLPLLIEDISNHGWLLLENAFWGVIALLLLIGLWWSKNRRLAWMFFALILYFAAVTGPIAHARYRIPVEPLMLLGAFSAAAYLYETRKSTTYYAP